MTDILSGTRGPDLGRRVLARRHDGTTIRTEGCERQGTSVADWRAKARATRRIPDPGRHVVTRGEKMTSEGIPHPPPL
jgi:hypothetical protein